MDGEKNIDSSVDRQQEWYDMWGIDNKKSMYFIMTKVIIAENLGLMIVRDSLILIIQQTLYWLE